MMLLASPLPFDGIVVDDRGIVAFGFLSTTQSRGVVCGEKEAEGPLEGPVTECSVRHR